MIVCLELQYESVNTPLVVIQTRTETKPSSSLLDKCCRGLNTFKPMCSNEKHHHLNTQS